MPGDRPPDPYRRPRVVVAALALVVALGTVGVALVVADGDGPSRSAEVPEGAGAERRAVAAYGEALEPLSYEAGRAVVQGLHVALARLSEGDDGDAEVLEDLSARLELLESLRARMAALDAPAGVQASAQVRLDAMDAYVEVTRTLVEAAGAVGSEREALLDDVVDLGKRADALWERADDLLSDARHGVGLPTTTTIPTG